MKPPVTIEALTAQWAKDATIDITEPAVETSRIPNLHAKYLSILTHHRMLVKRLSVELGKARHIKLLYYSGYLNNQDDLKKYNLEPFDNHLTREQLHSMIDNDETVIEWNTAIAANQEIIDTCIAILKEINNRTFQLGSVVKWTAFTQGTDI